MSNKTPKAGEFCWNELMTPNSKKAKKFYGDLFGWKAQEHDMGNNMHYTMFMQGENTVAGMMEIPDDKKDCQIPPHWMSYVSVKNLDETVEKAKKLGAKITVPSKTVEQFGRFSIIEDPTGAHVALWESFAK